MHLFTYYQIMPTEERIKLLIQRCLHKKETVEERDELNLYFIDPQFESVINECLFDAFDSEKDLELINNNSKEHILSAIVSTSENSIYNLSKMRIMKWISVAAAILLISIPLVLKENLREQIFNLYSGVNPQEKLVEDQKNKLIQPAIESATLELVDGTKLYLPDLLIGTEVIKNGLLIRKSGNNELSLKYVDSKYAKNKDYIIRTPKGGKYNLTLPDGTKVRLNSATTLSLPGSFTDSMRFVSLQGEAYFDVIKDNRTFIVYSQQHSIKQQVKVLGTAFNISAYADDYQIETTLVHGSVNVKNLQNNEIIFLKPNELMINNSSGMSVEKADFERNLAWLSNIFYFENETLDNVIKQISRWYDVDFKDVPSLPKQRLWAQVSRDLKLIDLLSIIEKTYALKFKIIGKEVYIVE